jgi:hypothetical protein
MILAISVTGRADFSISLVFIGMYLYIWANMTLANAMGAHLAQQLLVKRQLTYSSAGAP